MTEHSHPTQSVAPEEVAIADTAALIGSRVRLEPLRVEHVEEMVAVLSDPGLYRFTGGAPPTAAVLRARYGRQAAGRSPDGAQRWINWIVRLLAADVAVGYVQATVTVEHGHTAAELAWVIGSAYQGQGLAGEAASVVLTALTDVGVDTFRAHIHPDHHASAAVARLIGLTPTGQVVDGEMRWQRDVRPISGAETAPEQRR